jgi:hypothetical protein
MPGLVPGIHVLITLLAKKVVDGRVIGERKRRRSSNGLCPAMTSKYHAPAIVFSIAAIGQIQVSAFTSLGSRR